MDLDKDNGLEQIQNKLLEITLYFKQFCEEHGLKFVLAGGTCLGAARHKGFIPWDDDLDVFMLREDYEKLQKLWNRYADKERYTCLRSNGHYNIHHAATEIRDNHTTFIVRHSVDSDIHQGLMIDIIPLDRVSRSSFGRKIQLIYAMLFSCFNFQRLPEHKGKGIYMATKIALGVVRSFKWRYRIWKWAEKRFIAWGKRNNGLVASFIEGPKIFREQFPEDWFTNPAYLPFEGVEMPVPRDYDQWLKTSYGNYMKPVPPSERVPRHDIVFFDMDRPYKEYKGKYYCVKENKKR